MNAKSFFLGITLIFLSTLTYAGGGWVYKQGGGYFKFTQWWAVSPLSYDANGRLTNQQPVGYYNTSLYGEYGLSDRLTGIVYTPFFSRTTLFQPDSDPLLPSASQNGLGDIDLSLKYGLYQGDKFVVSVTALWGLPTGRVGTDENSPATGDGEMNTMLRVDASTGFGFGGVMGWVNAYAGFNNRTNGFNDEARFGAEIGFQLFNERVLAIGRVDRIDAIGPLDVQSGSIFTNNFEFTTVSAEVGLNITKKIGVAANVTKALNARSYFEAPAYSVGIYYNL
ncbi:MAG: hypothetical protein AAFY71_17515 [Bacteroidota bacterium]